jgi:hypothetical protein
MVEKRFSIDIQVDGEVLRTKDPNEQVSIVSTEINGALKDLSREMYDWAKREILTPAFLNQPDA